MKVEVKRRLDAPAAMVFADVSDFGNLARLDIVATCTVNGHGVGAIRTVTFADAALGRVVERLEAYDPVGRTFSYSIINDDCALPVSDYLATVRVIEDGEHGCVLSWGSEFQLQHMQEADAKVMFEEFYTKAIEAARCAITKS